jgi:amino acid permease
MGLFGGFLADIIMSWPKLESRYRITMLVQTAMWLTITMLLSVSQYVDAAAQFVLLLSCSPELLEATLRITLRSFGGAMTGFMLCIALFANQRDSPRVRRLAMVGGIASTIIYLVVGLALFYTVVKFAQ